jgi:SulP family sulfate permease
MGGGLYLVKIKEEACATLRRGGFRDLIGPENIFLTKADAIETIYRRLNPDTCARCTKRIFRECGAPGTKPAPTPQPVPG